MKIDMESARLVQYLFEKIISKRDVLIKMFFEKLFEFEPELKQQLNYDAKSSERYFSICHEIISNLGNNARLSFLLSVIIFDLNCLNLNESIYLSTGKAMLWSLTKTLGTNFNFESRKAWISIYLSIKQEIEIQREGKECLKI